MSDVEALSNFGTPITPSITPDAYAALTQRAQLAISSELYGSGGSARPDAASSASSGSSGSGGAGVAVGVGDTEAEVDGSATAPAPATIATGGAAFFTI